MIAQSFCFVLERLEVDDLDDSPEMLVTDKSAKSDLADYRA